MSSVTNFVLALCIRRIARGRRKPMNNTVLIDKAFEIKSEYESSASQRGFGLGCHASHHRPSCSQRANIISPALITRAEAWRRKWPFAFILLYSAPQPLPG